MKKLLFVMLIALALTGCKCSKKPVQNSDSPAEVAAVVENKGCGGNPKLTNDEIIAETNKCASAGLDSEPLHCGDDFETTRIQCKPKTTEVAQ